jgi:hypothetical protein
MSKVYLTTGKRAWKVGKKGDKKISLRKGDYAG